MPTTLSDFFYLQFPCSGDTEEEMEKAVKFASKVKKLRIHPILRKMDRQMANHFTMVAYRTHNITRLHFFLKEIKSVKCKSDSEDNETTDDYIVDYTDKYKYITTITLSDTVEIPDIYYYKSNNNKANVVKFEDSVEKVHNPSGKMNLNLEFFFEHYFLNAGDVEMASPLFDEYLSLGQIDSCIADMFSGLWFSSNDIRWQICILGLVHSYYSNMGIHIPYLKTTHYEFGNKLNFYTNKYNVKNDVERNYFISLDVSCDNCDTKVPMFFYHNSVCGDLCQKCYDEKLEIEAKRRNYLKYLLVLPGKRVIFNRNVSKMRKKISEMKFPKIKTEKKMELYQRVISNVAQDNQLSKSSCPICMDYFVKGPLERDISSGMCGHCFHTKCIHSTGSSRCPVCRKVTIFTPLFLAL